MELSGNNSYSLMSFNNFSLPAFVLLNRIGLPTGFPSSSIIAASWFRLPMSIPTKNIRINLSNRILDSGYPLCSRDDIASCEIQKHCSIQLIHILSVEKRRQSNYGRLGFKEENYDLYLYETIITHKSYRFKSTLTD